MRIIAFVGCSTGVSGDLGKNLPSVAVQRGAKVAIGFQTTITVEMANAWVERFFYLLSEGRTVQVAVETINGETYTYPQSGNTVSFSAMAVYIAGNETTTLY